MKGKWKTGKMRIQACLIMLLLTGCVSQYLPEIYENEELLVVEGLITDQPGPYTVSISRTLPIWVRDIRTPLNGGILWISDDLGNIDTLKEEKNNIGTFLTDSASFTGIPGRTYTLHLKVWTRKGFQHYESLPMEMKPVPSIDSIYYEKRNFEYNNLPVEGCQIYLDTHDPSNICQFYRWNFSETWEFRLPFNVPNKACWITGSSNQIFVKNTRLFNESMVVRFPLKLVTNPIDRLTLKYSILVNQYSLNEEEYGYWEKLKNATEQVGGLYDIIPSTIPSNIFCLEDHFEKVLGYFSVSSVNTKRFFIKDHFIGMNGMYLDCVDSVAYGTNPIIRGLGVRWWILNDFTDSIPPRIILTSKVGCADCTTRGTNIRPDFWDDDK